MAEDNTDNPDNRGWFGDPEGHAKAGKIGGDKVAAEKGPGFYEDIGKLGGQQSPGNFKNDPERAREAGRKGGMASNQQSLDPMDEDL